MYKAVVFLLLFSSQNYVFAQLWPMGVVHFSINKKDYDPHSQDIILSTFTQIEREICVKFFSRSVNDNTDSAKILFITNEKKKKTCEPEAFNYTGSVVEMTIGYKCVKPADIARMVVDMLRASIKTSHDLDSDNLSRQFQPRDAMPVPSSLLTATDRNYINLHYAAQCAQLNKRRGPDPGYRRTALHIPEDVEDPEQLSADNMGFYRDKLWPLGIIMYGVADDVRNTSDHHTLERAMAQLELSTCLVFQQSKPDDAVAARNLLWFSREGDDTPHFGIMLGNQSLNLEAFTHGAPGHNSHTLAFLLRAVGVPAASNRPDRDHYIRINWQFVEKGREHLLERMDEASWLRQFQYDFDSVTHPPANYMCTCACRLGEQTVQPLQDRLWQRTLSMGHTAELSEIDISIIAALYARQCQKRTVSPTGVHVLPPDLGTDLAEASVEDNEAALSQNGANDTDINANKTIDKAEPSQDAGLDNAPNQPEVNISTSTHF